MYTRNYARSNRYSPPPGYAGNAFVGEGEIKHHPPTDEVIHLPRDDEATGIEPVPQKENTVPIHSDYKEKTAISELFHSLRGKFGREELIILAVMLLISEDGVGAEVLILALTLIAG
ncbi:MAG: hypothetical protein E7628_05175 [Ruminococcaceae bacterium]|nr:hypothetical protein [Oscillospiraceae bacterium]